MTLYKLIVACNYTGTKINISSLFQLKKQFQKLLKKQQFKNKLKCTGYIIRIYIGTHQTAEYENDIFKHSDVVTKQIVGVN